MPTGRTQSGGLPPPSAPPAASVPAPAVRLFYVMGCRLIFLVPILYLPTCRFAVCWSQCEKRGLVAC